ncbi:M48 family metalloprotease (plasmid) [Haloarcula salina]|uniref:M48 family metalloprotease n=1 Tax=Haloarcula salina TaxID=1429914 RepID=UPI003C705DF8
MYDSYSAYIDDESDFGNRKFRYFESQCKLVEEFDTDYSYPLYCILVLSFTVLTHTTSVFTGIAEDVVLVTTGLGAFSLFLQPHILSHKKYDFKYTSHDASKKLGVPYLYRSVLRVSLLSYLMLVISSFNLWPWIFPEANILSYIITITAGLAILISIRRDPHDPVTVRFLFLYALAITPVTAAVSNVLIYTQLFAYRQQTITVLEPLTKVAPVQIEQVVFELISIHPTVFILAMNISLFALIIRLSPTIWSKIADAEPDRVMTDEVAQDRVVRISMGLLIGTYIISALAIPILVEFQPVKIGIDTTINLLWLYAPIILFGTLHTVIKLGQYFRRRMRLAAIEAGGSRCLLPDSEVRVVSSDEIKSPARGVDMLGRNPVVVINESLIQTLKTDEIRAIYNHELYHLQNGHGRYQSLSNLPLVGPLLFLIFINPKKVFQREYQADQHAIEKVNQQAVIRALDKTNQSTSVTDLHYIMENSSWDKISFLVLLTSIPVASLYRPTKTQRIQTITAN